MDAELKGEGGEGGRADFEQADRGEDAEEDPGFLDWWLVPIILCGVAVAQMVLAQTVDLSSWKGGGFGMFASVDSPSMRTVTAEGVDESGKRVRIDAFEVMSEMIR